MPPYPPIRLVHETLLETAAARPAATAVVVGRERYTYATLLDRSLRLARALRDAGVARGDRVVVFMSNQWPCVVAIYATLLAGGAVVIVNPQTKSEKLRYLLADSGARVLVTSAELARCFRSALEASGSAPTTICVGARAAAVPGVLDFDGVVDGTPPAHHEAATIPLDLAALIYTSGSTGTAKGVMLSHQNMVFAMTSIAQYLRLGEDDRILSVLPLAFDYGLYQLLMSVLVGATLVLEESFAFPADVLQRARSEAVTVFPIVPTIAATLIGLAARAPELTLSRVTRVTNTAAALPASFVGALRAVFPQADLFAMYGLTECKRVSYLDPALIDERPTSVGKAIPGTEVFLRTPEGDPVPPGEPGILHVRGPHVMLGYWQQPELSARMLRPGLYPGERILCTHDYFRIDDDGFLYFVGRSDDIIKSRGEKVSPVEVEDVLYSIPGVREAVVVGVPDVALGEAVRACIVRHEGSTLTERDVQRACAARLESFAVPREVVFVAELPKTPTGKIVRRPPHGGPDAPRGTAGP